MHIVRIDTVATWKNILTFRRSQSLRNALLYNGGHLL